jgi:formylglycine-generating enzyme required for sulfatase activity/serine/threonine protein kinase/ketosteroid isomerase-like protein
MGSLDLTDAVVADRYRVISLLGEGAMGSVFLAEDVHLHRQVALKVLRKEWVEKPEVAKRLENECRLMAHLGPHSNIVTLYDRLVVDGNAILVMELVTGETLADIIERTRSVNDDSLSKRQTTPVLAGVPTIVLTPTDAIEVARQCLAGLDFAHSKGVLHRDLKPGNIMIARDHNGRLVAKLMDFGIGKALREGVDVPQAMTALTQVGGPGPGTPAYMAPEQIEPSKFGEAGPAADLYAFGITLYEMLALRLPFEGTYTELLVAQISKPPPDLRSVLPSVDARLASVVARALEKRPENRFSSASHFASALEDPIERSGSSFSPTTLDPLPLTRPVRRRRLIVPATIVVALALLIGGGLLWKEPFTALVSEAPAPTVEEGISGEATPPESQASSPEVNVAQADVPSPSPSNTDVAPSPEPDSNPPVLMQPTEEPSTIETPAPGADEPPAAPGSVKIFDGVSFAWIPPGDFVMGGPTAPSEIVRMYGGVARMYEDEHPQHLVSISKGFWLSQHETTHEEFARFVTSTGYRSVAEKQGWGEVIELAKQDWKKEGGVSWRTASSPGFPVSMVSWIDATAYCEWLSGISGQRYRLPTEAEWEYACGAGSSALFPWGDDLASGAGWANVADLTPLPNGATWGNGGGFRDGHWKASPVGTFRANASGVHDMIGNVWEWCLDWYGPYPSERVVDPTGPATGSKRTLRGGSWCYDRGDSRTANRYATDPARCAENIGFRVVREAGHGEAQNAAASSFAVTPAPEAPDLRPELERFLANWLLALQERNLAKHMSCYADPVAPYFTLGSTSREEIRQDKQKALSVYDRMDLKMTNLEIDVRSPSRAVALFDKEWDATAPGKRFAGEVRQRLGLEKQGGRWQISSEEELQIYWVDK